MGRFGISVALGKVWDLSGTVGRLRISGTCWIMLQTLQENFRDLLLATITKK